MPALRGGVRGRAGREPPGGIVTYAADVLQEEAAYLAYHLHWDLDSILDLEHTDRQAYVRRVADLVQESAP
ncbi:hypothetical protein EF903_31460 [Streptomyces sp. WAC05292]|nr:hypothetical protein EF903_31460 [Streptomyces sp. WAC05292]